MEWICQYFDCNRQVICDYNVLEYQEDNIKKLKKKYTSWGKFSTALQREMIWRYWGKCEWELILERTEDGRILLKPWAGCFEPEKVCIDVTDRTDFDWKGFAEVNIRNQRYENEAKIDVYYQLIYRWDEFVDYCWNYHHKWQRKKRCLQNVDN